MLDNAATKERVRRLINPFVLALARTGVTPNMLTVIGVALNTCVGLIIAAGYDRLAGVLLILTSLFDLLDGALAKATGKASKFGAFLDSTLDRYSEAAVLLGVMYFSLQRNLILNVYLVYIVIVGSLMVSYTRARAEGLGLECRVGWFGRPERVVVLCAGLIFDLMLPALIILAIFTHFTALQRMIHVQRLTGRRR
jgi:CDP-diacylglycerol--glycerol-3-phosphate 3-phosphatidyltransferase